MKKITILFFLLGVFFITQNPAQAITLTKEQRQTLVEIYIEKHVDKTYLKNMIKEIEKITITNRFNSYIITQDQLKTTLKAGIPRETLRKVGKELVEKVSLFCEKEDYRIASKDEIVDFITQTIPTLI